MPTFSTTDANVSYDIVGDGPPLVLLHGFPQTRAMWAAVADQLKDNFTLVMPDLRGYGQSTAKNPLAIESFSFRAMASDVSSLMGHLGIDRYHLAGHDRGARVAHRLVLDRPDAVERLTLMDILPTSYLLENWNSKVSMAYWHWSFLALPAPFPEETILENPDRFFETCLTSWGGAQISSFEAIEEYRAAWRRAEVVKAMVNDYRAAVSIDSDNDHADQGRNISCPTQIIMGADGIMNRLFDVSDVWSKYADDFSMELMPGGHFFIDLHPKQTADALRAFHR
ncbi:MAG: alpha/beta hydrolase [Boseongicola sp.]|nr:alpha/beta hydrolase [Boseongicola sp.]MDD9977703.1 alpha/beta hydrolase [Boseongicola sp.]